MKWTEEDDDEWENQGSFILENNCNSSEQGQKMRRTSDGEKTPPSPNSQLAEQLIRKTINDGCPSRNPRDFAFIRSLGEGAYSCVYQARETISGAEFAVKVLQKAHVNRHEKMESVIREKNILNYITQTKGPHPFINQLYTAFHDQSRIYFVTLMATKGDLGEALSHFGSFDIPTTQFYGAEILDGISFLHSIRIVHRDLKPENILLQENGHIMITDFGSAKPFDDLDLPMIGFGEEEIRSSRSSDSGTPPPTSSNRTYSDEEEGNSGRRTTFVGTAQYVSPEMLSDGEVGAPSDLWAFGCIMYQFLAGQAPFRAVNQYHLMKKIQELDFTWPEGFVDDAKSIIENLLQKDPSQRMTSNEIKALTFFNSINWSTLSESTPPTLHAYIPATFGEPELYSAIQVTEPGLDDRTLARLMNIGLSDSDAEGTGRSSCFSSTDDFDSSYDLAPRSDSKVERMRMLREMNLEKQRQENPYHLFTGGMLILKQGILEKKRGLFARRRMFLLTEGPHLLYIDPSNMVLKGEIPWSPCMQTEVKNFGTFFIHTPNRVYYLFDETRHAVEWCREIENVRKRYENEIRATYEQSIQEGTFLSIYGKKKTKKEVMRAEKAARRKQEKETKKATKLLAKRSSQ